MKNKFTQLIYILALISTIAYVKPALAVGFVIADIPTMDTMAVGDSIVLDSAQGRIVQIPTSVSAKRIDIIKYYKSVLPNFGWIYKGETKYLRDDEVLIISISDTDSDGTTVEFTITTP